MLLDAKPVRNIYGLSPFAAKLLFKFVGWVGISIDHLAAHPGQGFWGDLRALRAAKRAARDGVGGHSAQVYALRQALFNARLTLWMFFFLIHFRPVLGRHEAVYELRLAVQRSWGWPVVLRRCDFLAQLDAFDGKP
jgi:hypothetical protein